MVTSPSSSQRIVSVPPGRVTATSRSTSPFSSRDRAGAGAGAAGPRGARPAFPHPQRIAFAADHLRDIDVSPRSGNSGSARSAGRPLQLDRIGISTKNTTCGLPHHRHRAFEVFHATGRNRVHRIGSGISSHPKRGVPIIDRNPASEGLTWRHSVRRSRGRRGLASRQREPRGWRCRRLRTSLPSLLKIACEIGEVGIPRARSGCSRFRCAGRASARARSLWYRISGIAPRVEHHEVVA